jgi:hypothetical protein
MTMTDRTVDSAVEEFISCRSRSLMTFERTRIFLLCLSEVPQELIPSIQVKVFSISIDELKTNYSGDHKRHETLVSSGLLHSFPKLTNCRDSLFLSFFLSLITIESWLCLQVDWKWTRHAEKTSKFIWQSIWSVLRRSRNLGEHDD